MQSLPEVRSQLQQLFGVFSNIGDILFLLLLFHLLLAQVNTYFCLEGSNYFVYSAENHTSLFVILNHSDPFVTIRYILCHSVVLIRVMRVSGRLE